MATGCGADAGAGSPDAAAAFDGALADAPLVEVDAVPGDAAAIDGDCPRSVGDVVIEHACLHVVHGPHAMVTAGSDASTVTANINAPHTHYTIELPRDSADPDRYRGAVMYRPAQDGDHALFFDPAVPLVLTDPAGAALPVIAGHDVATCAGVARVAVVHLERQVRYRVVVPAVAAPSVRLIVENLESFAPEDAWAQACP
jgi:hypothetical protein